MEDEDWDLTEDDTVIGTCEVCGRIRPVQRLIDPFITEGIDEQPILPEAFCKSCFQQRQDDV